MIRFANCCVAFTFVMLAASGQRSMSSLAEEPSRRPFPVPPGFVFQGQEISPQEAARLARAHTQLTLLNVSELSPDVAAALSENEPAADTFLWLPALASLDEAAARAISPRKGIIGLWGIRSLSPSVAASVGGCAGMRIELLSMDEVPPDVGRALAGWKRSGVVLGITQLHVELASILADYSGELYFPYLESVSLDAARSLSKHGRFVDFGGASVSPEVAEALLGHKGPLGLSRAKRLEPGVGEVLARHSAEVRLSLEEIDCPTLMRKLLGESHASASVRKLRVMSPEVAKEFVRSGRVDSLRALRSLEPAAASELAKLSSELDLPGFAELTPEVARALTDRTPAVRLRGIKSLVGPEGVAVAKALAETPAPVDLKMLELVSESALDELRKKPSIALPPEQKLSVVP